MIPCVSQLVPSNLSNSPFRYSISSMIFSSLPLLPIPRSRRLLRAKRRISLQFSPLEKMIPDQHKSIRPWVCSSTAENVYAMSRLSLDLWDIYSVTLIKSIVWQVSKWLICWQINLYAMWRVGCLPLIISISPSLNRRPSPGSRREWVCERGGALKTSRSGGVWWGTPDPLFILDTSSPLDTILLFLFNKSLSEAWRHAHCVCRLLLPPQLL